MGLRFLQKSLCLLIVSLGIATPTFSYADDVVYTYDDHGRIKTVIYTGTGKKITYSYDKVGNRTSVVITANSPPTAVNDVGASGAIYEDIDIYVLTNDTDPDGDTLTITDATTGTSGCFVDHSSTYITVLRTSKGSCTVTYYISDGNGGTDSATSKAAFLYW